WFPFFAVDYELCHKSLMAAVLTPGLCRRFKLRVLWIPAYPAEIFLDDLHLLQVQKQAPFFRKLKKLLIRHIADQNCRYRPGRTRNDKRRRCAKDFALHCFVEQQAVKDNLDV